MSNLQNPSASSPDLSNPSASSPDLSNPSASSLNSQEPKSLKEQERKARRRATSAAWRTTHKEHIKVYRKKLREECREEKTIGALRECACGVVAFTEEDLQLFTKDIDSSYGRRNTCKDCSAKSSRQGKPKRPPQKSCGQCKKTFIGVLNIEQAFRRTKGTQMKIIGELAPICLVCEFPLDRYYKIDGRYVLKEIK